MKSMLIKDASEIIATLFAEISQRRGWNVATKPEVRSQRSEGHVTRRDFGRLKGSEMFLPFLES
jgi:hypothetical protein